MRWDLVSFFTFIFRHSSCLEFDDIIKKYSSRKEEKSLKYFTSFLNFIFPVYSSSFECYIIITIIGMKKKKNPWCVLLLPKLSVSCLLVGVLCFNFIFVSVSINKWQHNDSFIWNYMAAKTPSLMTGITSEIMDNWKEMLFSTWLITLFGSLSLDLNAIDWWSQFWGEWGKRDKPEDTRLPPTSLQSLLTAISKLFQDLYLQKEKLVYNDNELIHKLSLKIV